jgi:hypothetical protein
MLTALSICMRRIWLYCLPVLTVLAQAQTSTYSISGTVLNSATGTPINNAVVTLTSSRMIDSSNGPRQIPISQSKLVGSAGIFQFDALSAGHFRLTAQKPGFTMDEDASPGSTSSSDIELTSSLKDWRVKLAPLGSIDGKVVDQEGAPVRGVNVIALSVAIVNGVRTTKSERSVSTNDIGVYRFWNLQPGKYYIKAAGRSGGTLSFFGDGQPIAPDSDEGFAPSYSGGASALDFATSMVIGHGTHAQADIRVVREPAVKVRGIVGNVIASSAAKFELLRGDEDGFANRATLNTTTGRFEIEDVIAGNYVLRVTQGDKGRAETMVAVGSQDVNNVSLSVAPAVTVKALVRTIGSPKRTPAIEDQLPELNPNCQVSLRALGVDSPRTYALRPEENEDFAVADVLPGDYRIELSCNDGYVLSALSGNTDLLSNSRFTIQPGVTPPPVEISVKPGGAIIHGTLRLTPMPPNAAVLVVPSFSASTGPLLLPLYSAPDQASEAPFDLPSVAPGDYTIYAFSRSDDIEYANPAFLQSLRGGVRVRVEDGDQSEIVLTSTVR